jgi:hypothetical protein
MSHALLSRRAALAAALTVVFVSVSVCVWFGSAGGHGAWWSWADNGAAPPGPRPGFREEGREAGIRFRMNFLPTEQGEKFKFNLYDHGCGVAVADFDGDGRDDVYFCNQLGPNALYRNNGDGTFSDVTDQAGVGLSDRICVGATFADYDNSGRQSLFVTSTRGGNVLFKNMGDGTFKDVTKEAGLDLVAHSQTAVFFDFDNDGYLDLFVTNSAKWTLDAYDPANRYYPGPSSVVQLTRSVKEYNVLYRNNGDGTFTDVTARAGLAGKGWGGDVAVFDYNGDGRLDLFVTSMFGANQLYRNNGDGTFTDVTKAVLGRTSWGAIGCKAFDFNNDGRLDLLVVDMHSDMWLPPDVDPRTTADDLRTKYKYFMGPYFGRSKWAVKNEELARAALQIRYEDVLFGNTLFKHLPPDGIFEEVSEKANMETFWPWGVATGDFDNDGFEDVFLPAGMGHPYAYWPNSLMMNNGDGTFVDRAASMGIEPPPEGIYLEEKIGGKDAARSSRCAAVADFSGTGRLDLVVNNFNDRAFLFRNHFPRKNYVAFRLKGTKSNRDAIGAVVRLHLGDEVLVRQVHGAGGYLSQSSKTLHFGLGDRNRIDRVEITWPGNRRQSLGPVEINALHDVVEPEWDAAPGGG